jgi:hypothetical protein
VLLQFHFRVSKWKHVDPLPAGTHADDYEDAVAWIAIPA